MSTEAKKLIQHVCKDFLCFSCQGKGYKVSLSMASFLLKTSSQLCLYTVMYCSLMQTGPANQSAHNNYVILSDGLYALI